MEMIFIILAINVVYVSFLTVRMILTLKGQKYLAAAISTVEVCIYVIGLGLVLDNLDKIQNLMAYAIGYGLGVLIGSKIEEWMALGYVTVQVISNHYDQELPRRLRQAGFGVTSWMGEGMDGPRLVMEILARRKNQGDLYRQILAYDAKAFIIAYEPKQFHGGFWVKSLKNREFNVLKEQDGTRELAAAQEQGVTDILDGAQEGGQAKERGAGQENSH